MRGDTVVHSGPRIAVVTGSTTGIGKEVVRQLAQQGVRALVTGRDVARAEAACASIDEPLTGYVPIPLDVTSQESVDAVIALVSQEYGGLDVLVNNAVHRINVTQSPENADMAEVESIYRTNVVGPWRMTQAALPLLREGRQPRVVNVSSVAGTHGPDPQALPGALGVATGYAVSKAALNALTTAFAAVLIDTTVIVNAVCPGWTATWDGGLEAGARPVPEGAASVVWAAMLADDGPRGGLFRDGQPLPW